MPGGHFLEKSVRLGTPRVVCTTHIVETGGGEGGAVGPLPGVLCQEFFARTRLEWSEGVEVGQLLRKGGGPFSSLFTQVRGRLISREVFPLFPVVGSLPHRFAHGVGRSVSSAIHRPLLE